MRQLAADRFLELFFAHGGDCYLRADGKIALKAPAPVLDAIMPQVRQIGRDALLAALEREDRASRRRLGEILSADHHHRPANECTKKPKAGAEAAENRESALDGPLRDRADEGRHHQED